MDVDYYVIVTDTAGSPKGLIAGGTWQEAVEAATKAAIAADSEYAATLGQDAIREELNLDGCWSTHSGDVWVYILQAESL